MSRRQYVKQLSKKNLLRSYGPILAVFMIFALIQALSYHFELQRTAEYRYGFYNDYYSNYYGFGIRYVPTLGIISVLLSIFVLIPLEAGVAAYCLNVYRGYPPQLRVAFGSSGTEYGRRLGGMLWQKLFIFLWSLLFVIVGIVKSYSYAMMPYILYECPHVSIPDALKLSKRMMHGYKAELFVQHLSFIGWNLLSVLAAGVIIGVALGTGNAFAATLISGAIIALFVTPYRSIADAGFYHERMQECLNTNVVSPYELGWY